MTTQRNFQVNLRGVIDLLSDHLYSGPHVYIRELLQNGIDAITARQQVDPSHAGAVKLEIIEGSDSRPTTLVAYDNGIGLTEDEVHEFLATIGQSSKRDTLERQDFIGQFGIGLLSGFVVSDEIVVITRSVKSGAKTVEWKGRADGTYSLRTIEYDFEPGTQVFLRCKPGCDEFFEAEFVEKTARYFGRHLPVSVTIDHAGVQTQINERPPWQRSFEDARSEQEEYLDYGEDAFGLKFLDAIPLRSQVGGVEGVAFILPHASSLTAKRTHRVYLKNMLLSETVENLLPDWAFFVKCVINATELRPTAARESFYEDENLNAARQALGGCLRNYLVRLARDDRSRLDHIVDLHFLPMKALAVDDDEFYRLFIDWLPFETSLGEMTLAEYCERESVVRYVRTRDQFRQIAGVASAQSICVVNTGYTYDRDLIEKLPVIFPDREIEEVEVSQLAQNFGELTLQERDEVFHFMNLADQVLQPYRCRVEIKRFEPMQLPTLYTTNDAATFLRSVEQSQEIADDLWSGVLDRIAETPSADATAQLCLNYNNPLIRKIARLKSHVLTQRSVEMLYVQALLLGHYPLKSKEMNLLSEGLLGLIELGVNSQEGN